MSCCFYGIEGVDQASVLSIVYLETNDCQLNQPSSYPSEFARSHSPCAAYHKGKPTEPVTTAIHTATSHGKYRPTKEYFATMIKNDEMSRDSPGILVAIIDRDHG